jgi:hypothetical protein
LSEESYSPKTVITQINQMHYITNATLCIKTLNKTINILNSKKNYLKFQHNSNHNEAIYYINTVDQLNKIDVTENRAKR